MTTTTQIRPSSRRRRRGVAAGLTRALAGPHGLDAYLEQIRPTWTLGEARAEITAANRQTPDSVTLGLRANRAWGGTRAGQFVTVGVEIDGVRRTRCYSPASIAGRCREIELTVRAHPEGLVSNFLCERADPGMFVTLSEAGGDFHLPDTVSDPVLLISGGSGITPVMSMLRTLCAAGHRGPVTFLHYAPDREHALYADQLSSLAGAHPNVDLVRSFTREPGEGEADGHFRRSHLMPAAWRARPDRDERRERPEHVHLDALTFACGPPSLLDSVRAAWAEDGIEHRLHIESFVPPSFAPPSGEAEGLIRFTGSGVELANDGSPLLDQAEAAGLSPDSGCRMGICHTCACRKTAGVVRNLNTGETSSSEEEEIQLCISAPVGDVSIEI